jgi:cytochrome c2
MALTDDGFLIARDLEGAVKFYSFKDDFLSTLAFKLPATNRDKLPKLTPSGRKVDPDYVRYQDVEIFTGPDGNRHLAVTLDYYDPERVCFSTRLEEALLPANWQMPLAIGSDAVMLDWKILIAGAPCLPFAESRNSFGGNQAGGRIVRAPDGGLFMSSGDLEFDGIDSKRPVVSQEAGSTYGRVFHVDPASGAVEQWSMGHRNPQGMTLDSAGRLWTVEHGAMGGDELNWIRRGSNFGWPNVTLGVLYTDPAGDAKYWPLSHNQGRHDGYVEPTFAWIPSIAPSAVALVDNLDPRWDGDLLVSALAGQALHRLRMNGTSVVYDETVPMGRRVRDLAIAHGRIYLLFDDGTFGYMTPHRMQDADSWKSVESGALQDSGCIECHSNSNAPELVGIVGSDIASQLHITYSAGLKAAHGTWSRDTLTAFLADPSKFAPGTNMPKLTLSSEELHRVIDELEALHPEPAPPSR